MTEERFSSSCRHEGYSSRGIWPESPEIMKKAGIVLNWNLKDSKALRKVFSSTAACLTDIGTDVAPEDMELSKSYHWEMTLSPHSRQGE